VSFPKRDAWAPEAVAATYEARRFRGPLRRRKHRRDVALVLELLRRAGGVHRVLDAPAGTGRMIPALVGAGYEAVAADVSRAMLLRAPAAPRLPAGARCLGRVCADLEALPLRAGSFDAVLCLRFLFHVRDPDVRRAMLAEMARVARGCVVGQVRYRATGKHALRWARSRVGLSRRYRPSEGRADIARELAQAGLELVELRRVSALFSDKALFLARVAPRPRELRDEPPRRRQR